MNIIKRKFRSVTSFHSLQRLVIMLSCSIVVIATLSSFLLYGLFAFNHESRDRLGALGDIISADIGAALAFGDNQAITTSLASLRADPSIKQLFVLDEHDQVSGYYHQKMEEIPTNLQQRLKAMRSKTRQHIFEVSPQVERPVIRNGIRLGTIIIEQDEHIITDKIAASSTIGAAVLLLALLFSYLLANRFQRIITEPVTIMATAMMEISNTKNYSMRVGTSGTDEMDQLAEHFNEMLSEIERRDWNLLERQEQLYNLANFDSLTNLPNRALFNDRLDQALHRAVRTGERLAVLFIDLDDFKNINDTHGHRTGDQLLQETACRLAADTRADDTLARLGGDEFIIFLQDVKTSENALFVARKHMESLYHHYRIDDKRLFVSASIGVAVFPEHGEHSEILVKNADLAMYSAKEAGKNSVKLFTESLHLKLSEKVGLSNDLHKAMEQGEFELYYQPRINLEHDSWASAEALIRWHHPELGMVPPDKFIPLAEQTGLIIPIGEWVIREACRQLHEWHCQGFHLPRVSVSVSPLQLQRQDLVGIVKDATTSNDLCTLALELEILESALVEDVGRSIIVLKELRDIGVKISIDDFGTGYSSLSYLRTLPVDILKIDRSFLHRAHLSKEDELILAAIITMSQRLGLEVVTEGVECIEQARILKKHNCEEAQGYYYARPTPADRLLQRYLSSQKQREDVSLTADGDKTTCRMLTTAPAISCGQVPNLFCLKQTERPSACAGSYFCQSSIT